MTDRIVLEGMVLEGRHGVHDWERETAQPFELDVELELDLREAARADDLARTVDYGAVFQSCREIVEGRSWRLLEALAEDVAGHLLAAHPSVESVTVRIRKRSLALDRPIGSAGVEITRRRTA